MKEASFGDPVVAQARLSYLQPLPLLIVDEVSLALAEALLNAKAVPRKVEDDALHIALATTNGVDYLLTWHIANAVMQPKINQVCRDLGYKLPVICTPQALVEDQDVA